MRPPSASGSIPACAGKPGPSSPLSSRRGVHPRVCGEATGEAVCTAGVRGPSPRVRGSRVNAQRSNPEAGSIPACAGKPVPGRWTPRRSWVHPRVCGEAIRVPGRRRGPWGPSPRVRGSRGTRARPGAARGSIPACAGKPRGSAAAKTPTRVHPRVCGEAVPALFVRSVAPGPSPRVRGSPPAAAWPACLPRSIPACAGKPLMMPAAAVEIRVHPRVCGEAVETGVAAARAGGPSPRVRGSHLARARTRKFAGSIPACAGKPTCAAAGRRRPGVHPRVCGEAHAETVSAIAARGPSPRVRGSLRSWPNLDWRSRSIPACAGKPVPPVVFRSIY